MLLSWERQHRLPTRQMLYVLNIFFFFFTLNSTELFAVADTGNELIDGSRHMAEASSAPRGVRGGWVVFILPLPGRLSHICARPHRHTQSKTHINEPQTPKHTHRHTSACMENVTVVLNPISLCSNLTRSGMR